MRELTYPDPPPIGTVVGPNGFGEFLVVREHRAGGGVAMGYATVPDLQAAAAREPNSVAEVKYGPQWRARWPEGGGQ